MLAIILTTVSVFGLVIILAALLGALIETSATLFQQVQAIHKKLFSGMVFIPIFSWTLLKNYKVLPHFVWVLATAPFAIALGIFMGICDFFRHPADFTAGRRQSHFQSRLPHPAIKALPQKKS